MKYSMTESDMNKTIEHIVPQSNYGNTTDHAVVASKVQEDINFLRDRIDRIKKLKTPNSSVLKTYQSMLESREAVLAWLQDNGEAEIEKDDAVQVG